MDLGHPAHLDLPVEHIFFASRRARGSAWGSIRSENGRVDYFATTGATDPRDVDLTNLVLKVHVILRYDQSPTIHAGVVAGLRERARKIVSSPIRFHSATRFVANRS